MKRVLLLCSLAVAVCLGWYVASPWLAMKGIVDAAQDSDVAALEERIDFDRIQANTNAQIADAIEDRTEGGNALERIGGRIAGAIAERVVDNAMTPQGMVNMVNAGAVALPLVPERFRGQELSWDVERGGLDEFHGVSTWEDGSSGPVMVFERDGIGWDLVAVELGEN